VCVRIHFVVELNGNSVRIRDILVTVVRGGRLVKIVTNGLLCLWSSCCGIQADKAEWQLYCRLTHCAMYIRVEIVYLCLLA